MGASSSPERPDLRVDFDLAGMLRSAAERFGREDSAWATSVFLRFSAAPLAFTISALWENQCAHTSNTHSSCGVMRLSLNVPVWPPLDPVYAWHSPCSGSVRQSLQS